MDFRFYLLNGNPHLDTITVTVTIGYRRITPHASCIKSLSCTPTIAPTTLIGPVAHFTSQSLTRTRQHLSITVYLAPTDLGTLPHVLALDLSPIHFWPPLSHEKRSQRPPLSTRNDPP